MEKEEQAQLRNYVEEMGKLFEIMGFNPMQGRIMGYLSTGSEPEKTFDEIVSFFGTSKSTVSNSLKYLIDHKLVDYRTVSGKRKRYFFLTGNLPRVYSEKQLETVRLLKEMSYRTLTLQGNLGKEQRSIIHEWIEFANQFENMLNGILEPKKS